MKRRIHHQVGYPARVDMGAWAQSRDPYGEQRDLRECRTCRPTAPHLWGTTIVLQWL